jgi:hypothetical protein
LVPIRWKSPLQQRLRTFERLRSAPTVLL